MHARSGRWFLVATAALVAGCGGAQKRGDGMESGLPLDALKAKRARYANVELTVPRDQVSATDREVLVHLVRASEAMNRLFWIQGSRNGWEIRQSVATREGEYFRVLTDYIDLNFGPWDRLDEDQPFWGNKTKPAGAAFYPPDMTKDEFEAWLKAHPGDRPAFESPVTTIHRRDGKLVAVPYSQEYGQELDVAVRELRAAAAITKDEPLKRYLESRAAAFLSNDYFQSDMDWMDLGTATGPDASAIDVTIGPYEVYEDGLFNLKAAFEAFVTVRDAEESRKLAMVGGLLDELEANLPLDDRHKNFSRGKSSPIRVVNVVHTSGDAAKGVQTTAFNLPNDERVRAAKGSKKVMLKNVGEAKFKNSLIPISKTVMEPALMGEITFDAYFNFILMHEVSHGLGPGILTRTDGSKTTVNLALKETYSAIEEAKADVLGIYNTLYLAQKGTFPADLGPRSESTFVAGIFRSVRFGIGEAHGKANIVEFNALRKAGAITYDEQTKRFGVDRAKFGPAIRDLARRLLTIEAEGDYEGAKKLLEELGSMPPEVASALERLRDVPVDIRPRYTFAEGL